MKHTNTPKWKTIILAFICIIALLTLAGGTYAAYTSQAFQRGVARNRDTETVRFTSNYMQSCASGTEQTSYQGRTVLFSADDKTNTSLTLDLYVYNYANGNAGLISQRDITYDLKISFSGSTGSEYTVTPEGETTLSGKTSYTITNRTLRGRAANYHKYTITFPGSDLDKLKITAAATPQNVAATNNQILAAVISPCTGSTTQTFSAKGEFIDTTALPTEYKGFNYEISISSGKATGTLKWDTDTVEIDKFFLKNIGKSDAEIAQILKGGSLTLEMDQSAGSGDYLIPFYIKDENKIPSNWDEMKKKITFAATQIAEQSRR